MNENVSKIEIIDNSARQGKFDHSCKTYYKIDVDYNGKVMSLLFRAQELNVAAERFQKWNNKNRTN